MLPSRNYGTDGLNLLFLSDKVGDLLKSPVNPIWVVCSESHYSVLFCPDRSIVSYSPTATTAATAAPAGVAGEQRLVARKAGGRNPCHTAGYNAACATHVDSADRSNDASSTGGGAREDALRVENREGAGGGKHDTPPCKDEDTEEALNLEYYDGLGRQDEVRPPRRILC